MSWVGFEQEGDIEVPENRWFVKPGDQFNYWTIISTPRWRKRKKTPGRVQHVVVRCTCGHTRVEIEYFVRKGYMKSCGCKLPEFRAKQRKYSYVGDLKECGKCRRFLPTTKFNNRKDTYDKLGIYCKDCSYFRNICRLYGMSKDAYETMLRDQGGACAICKRTDCERFHVDHRHADAVIRGILCTKCNTLLGLSDESPEVLNSAIAYLERTAAEKAPEGQEC